MSSTPILRVHKNKEALIKAAADIFIEKATATIKKKEKFSVCLSGGKTPKPLYELLATPEYAEQINWKKCHFFFSDERCVPDTHENSNFGMIYDTLLKVVKVPKHNIRKIDGAIKPRYAAQAYTQAFQEFFGASLPVFDLVYLGMGADGHTASLFPNSPAVRIVRKRVREVYLSKTKSWRITLTGSVFNRAKTLIFLVAGKKKAPALKEVLQGEYNPDLYPAQLMRDAKGEVIWLLDEGVSRLL